MDDIDRQVLISENHNLIYSFIRKYGLTEDWYGVCAIGLCKAAKLFDESRGIKFSTLAYRVMYLEMMHELRDHVYKGVKAESLEDVLHGYDDVEIGSKLACSCDLISDAETIAYIDWVIEHAAEKDLMILQYALDGITQSKIGKLLGISQANVNRRLKNFLNCYREGKKMVNYSTGENLGNTKWIRDRLIRKMRAV